MNLNKVKNIDTPEHYVIAFFITILFIHSVAYLLYKIDIPYFGRDAIRQYQIHKINDDSKSINTVFVGDSSLGNALDAGLFSELTEKNALNLALMQGFGIIGSTQMAEYAIKKSPEIKNVVFMHIVDIWTLPFDIESYLDLKNSMNVSYGNNSLLSGPEFFLSLKYQTSIKEYLRFVKYMSRQNLGQKTIEDDYIKQSISTYANGEIVFEDNHNSRDVNYQKIIELQIASKMCHEKNVNCIFIHGPIHQKAFSNINSEYMESVASTFEKNQTIHYLPEVLLLPDKMLGDSINHVDNESKRVVTKTYAELLKPLLQ